MNTGRLDGIVLYPVKSARGIALGSATVGARGLLGDRDWMVVDPRGRFVTQRTLGGLARLAVTPTAEGLVLQLEGMDALVIPRPVDGHQSDVDVWGDRVWARDAGESAANWLSLAYGEALRLVWMPPEVLRPADPDYAGSAEVPVSFADGFPLLVTNRASLDDLNERLPAPIPMDRFRPNLVIAGWPAFAEDDIRLIRCGDVELELVKPCTRCKIPALDQQTGDLSTDPTPALKAYRYDAALRGVTFGVNAVIRSGSSGMLRLGDSVNVLA